MIITFWPSFIKGLYWVLVMRVQGWRTGSGESTHFTYIFGLWNRSGWMGAELQRKPWGVLLLFSVMIFLNKSITITIFQTI